MILVYVGLGIAVAVSVSIFLLCRERKAKELGPRAASEQFQAQTEERRG